MKIYNLAKLILFFPLLLAATNCLAEDKGVLEGTWRITSYFNAVNQVRYEAEGYMMFGKDHYMHLMFLNRDERSLDFSEVHHGTYRITGPATFDMIVDVDMHIDPKRELQDETVWYGSTNDIRGLNYRVNGKTAVIDFPSSTQIVMERVE